MLYNKDAPLQKLIVIGQIHRLQEAWLSVLGSHSPPLAFHSNPDPNGFLYPESNQPTQPCRGGQCLPNCVQVVWCANVVIDTDIVGNYT